MSEDEILVEYFNKITPVKKTSSLEEFISQLTYKFFLTEKMKSIMTLSYIDDENEEILIKDIEDYSMFLAESKQVILKIPEKSKPSNMQGGIDGIREKFKKKMDKLKSDIESYKNNLKEICKNTIGKKSFI